MKFGIRIPSINKRIAARTSVKRIIRHNLGFKAPKGFGWITNPKKALYNRVYNKTTSGCMLHLITVLIVSILFIVFSFSFSSCSDYENDNNSSTYVKPSIDKRGRIKKGHVRMPTSTKKDAIKNRNRSRYYDETRGKYRRKKKKD
jgi:hypothetical protein